MPKVNYPYLCGVDWFQVYGFMHSQLPAATPSFRLSVADYPTAQFLAKCSVYYESSLFCDILFAPRISSLPANCFQLKINNMWLYTSRWYELFQRVCTELNLEYKSVSRIDVFFDCIRYRGGRRPRTLIADYVAQKILKIGVNRGYLAFQNFGYSVAINAASADVPIGAPNFNGCTWGQKGYVQTQIYNKSLELRQEKFKPWIVDAWEDAGLKGEDVWRTEIRIQKNGKSLQLLESGELFALGADEVANEARVWDLFRTYADRYLRFVVRDYHRKRQQMQPIVLFPDMNDWEPPFRLKHPRREVCTNRTVSIVRNYLHTVGGVIASLPSSSESKRYGRYLRDAEDSLEKLFSGYKFGEPSSRYSPEIAWLAARRLNPSLKGGMKVRMSTPVPVDMFAPSVVRIAK